MYFIYFYVSRLLCSFAIYSNPKRVFGQKLFYEHINCHDFVNIIRYWDAKEKI